MSPDEGVVDAAINEATKHRSDAALNSFGFTGKLDVGSATGSGSGGAIRATALAAANS